MVTKVNGAAYKGVWVEKNTAFIKISFNANISALTPTTGGLVLAGTSTAVTGSAVADSTFGVVESLVVQALKIIATKATILAISSYNASGNNIDVFVGSSEGWMAAATNGFLGDSTSATVGYTPTLPAKAVLTTAGTNTTGAALGAIVDVSATASPAITYGMEFVKFNGSLPVVTSTDLIVGPGQSYGIATSPNGGTGYLPLNNGVGA